MATFQEPGHGNARVLPDHTASSPTPEDRDSGKQRRPPTITPKRFTRFFTPRTSSLGGRKAKRQSRSGRQLRDITRHALNQKSDVCAEQNHGNALTDSENITPRRSKRVKFTPIPESSPIPSSPTRRFDLEHGPSQIPTNRETLVDLSEDDDLESMCEIVRQPRPIRRYRESTSSHRQLQRSFGGYSTLHRGRKVDHCADWQNAAANFYSGSKDSYNFRNEALPFCTISCNLNSMVALGDEDGGVRLVDSSGADGIEFSKTHVSFKPHRNAVMDMAFSADDYLLATASGDQTARVIDMRTQQIRYVMTGHISSVKQIRFQPGNDNVLATSSRDGSVQIWDLRLRGMESPLQAISTSLGNDEDDSGLLPRNRKVIYARTCISIKDAHAATDRTVPSGLFAVKPEAKARRPDVSITAISFLPQGREHLFISASEANASVKLWDIRARYTSRKSAAMPISSTKEPESHIRNRRFGVSSLVLGADGARLYSLCRDNTVYAYSTNHLVLGHAPELSDPIQKWRRPAKEDQLGLGPLYGFRHENLQATSFYVKAAVRPAKTDKEEMLAVGSRDGCAVLFPTDEKYFSGRYTQTHVDEDDSDDGEEDGLPRLRSSQRLNAALRQAAHHDDSLPIYNHGTSLLRGHQKEVTSVGWTVDGELVTVSDDFTARCWREGSMARDLRLGGEAGGMRWNCGWADVRAGHDEEE